VSRAAAIAARPSRWTASGSMSGQVYSRGGGYDP
jgi:hypothetical protein